MPVALTLHSQVSCEESVVGRAFMPVCSNSAQLVTASFMQLSVFSNTLVIFNTLLFFTTMMLHLFQLEKTKFFMTNSSQNPGADETSTGISYRF